MIEDAIGLFGGRLRAAFEIAYALLRCPLGLLLALSGRANRADECPLWGESGHDADVSLCPLMTQSGHELPWPLV